MTQREVYQLFAEWFDSVCFVEMTDRERGWLWHGFSVGYCHANYSLFHSLIPVNT